MNADELDTVLKNLNASATAYEAYVINSVEPEKFTYAVFTEYVAQEVVRVGEPLASQIIEYILSMIWCYANTPVEEGDIIAIKPAKHTSKGAAMVNQNPNLIGEYIFPLFLYGVEYFSTAHFLLSDEDLDLSDLGYDPETFSFDRFLSSMLQMALQARYKHIRQCHLDREFGGEMYKENFGDEEMPEGRIVLPVEE